ncbi:unnamed protein product [Blepharisma stoltei]|uniref:Malectin domain-containing protein n=1 Tax=Blepharisma stoltei TaxID=1481888 RepID=A0AAU9J6B8_9CILI|nr:unnamed protein product [Blepharisma stoltei]
MVIFLSLLFPLVLSLDPKLVKYAVNCGGDSIVTSDGVTYRKDNGFSSGIASDYGKQFQIRLTRDLEIYQTERYDEQDFTYKIPIKEEGNYVLILKFSEVYFSYPSAKIFNVKIGDTYVVKQLDIFSKVGKAAAYDEFIVINYEGGKIKINGNVVENAVSHDELIITFEKGQKDNPKVNAIVLLKGGLEDTHQYEQSEFLAQIQRERLAQKQAQEKVKEVKREEIDDSDFESLEQEVHAVEEPDSLFSVLTSTPALVIVGIIALLAGGAIFSSSSGKPDDSKKAKKN